MELCFEEEIWDGIPTVAHVRDIFDLSEARSTLNSVFVFASNDVCFVNEVYPKNDLLPPKRVFNFAYSLSDFSGSHGPFQKETS